MNTLIDHQRPAIAALCSRFGVRRLDLFGSAATTRGFDPTRSDFDFVADFTAPAPTPEYADRVLGFAEALEELLGRRVDLVTATALRGSSLARTIAASRHTVYDSSRTTAA
ncbi:MAG: nucleotidyltransferase domain-containing protein [Opitutaceae bacterium]|nr:nucleotidyltransferase domain-containing protein [Opitutaceae bacterium]